MSCNKCNEQFTLFETPIYCKTECGKKYHAECIDVSYDVIKITLQYKNVYFICDECIELLKKFRKDDCEKISKVVNDEIGKVKKPEENASYAEFIGAIEHKFNQLYNDINTNKQNLEHVEKIVNIMQNKAVLHSDDEDGKCSKLNREDSDVRIIKGKSQNHSNVLAAEPTTFLHISNVALCTSENDVSLMVAECLDTNVSNVYSKILLPKHVSDKDLSFLTFKVRIKANLKDKAFDEDTWPIGIVIREFIERNNCSVFKPFSASSFNTS
uniref:Zinc finger PHD-type domain-containing protein n=1 Tax=Corethrella appendiculata TaxID=1370023 RepID=U5EPT9_9DIPT